MKLYVNIDEPTDNSSTSANSHVEMSMSNVQQLSSTTIQTHLFISSIEKSKNSKKVILTVRKEQCQMIKNVKINGHDLSQPKFHNTTWSAGWNLPSRFEFSEDLINFDSQNTVSISYDKEG